MGFPRQEYQSGVPFPSPGHLPDPGNELMSPTLADGFFTTEPPGKPLSCVTDEETEAQNEGGECAEGHSWRPHD